MFDQASYTIQAIGWVQFATVTHHGGAPFSIDYGKTQRVQNKLWLGGVKSKITASLKSVVSVILRLM